MSCFDYFSTSNKVNDDSLSNKDQFLGSISKLKAEKDKKFDYLINLDVFILDNSMRETTVASLRAHTLENKEAIFNEVKKCGFTHYIVEAFNAETRIGELFVQMLIDKKEDLSGAFVFAEMWEKVVEGVPQEEPIPVGLQKCQKYGIKNVIIEFDLLYHKIDYDAFNMTELCKYIKSKMDWIRANLSAKSLIVVNFRDFSNTMKHKPERVWHVINFLSSLPEEDRVFGIAYEDMGKCTIEDLTAWTTVVRAEMDRCGWNDGHFLIHVHEQWGLMHAVNLSCLANGATGMWAGVCTEGAGIGHADSCTAILNLIKLGNVKVQERYNCKYLREAARKVTEISSGFPPNPRTPIYGDRALDMLFGSTYAAMEHDPLICEGFDLAKFLGIERTVRVSTMASGEMIALKLQEVFGPEDPQFTEALGDQMKDQILANATDGRKEEYDSDVGLAMLLDQAGGKLTPQMTEIIEQSNENEPHIEALIKEIKKDWDMWDGRDGDVDNQLSFDHFYVGFMSPYFGCYRCDDTQMGLSAIDMDADGMVDWFEFRFYLVWAGRQYPEVRTSQELLDKAFRFGLIPAMLDECSKIREKKADKS